MAALANGHLFRVTLVAVLLYAALECALTAPQLILVEDGLLLAISGGCAVAYLPIAWAALLTARPTRGHWLGLGIEAAWVSQIMLRLMSIVFRQWWPDIVNTHWRTLAVAPMIFGGMLHLWAPNADDGDLRASRWVFPGLVVGLGIFFVWLLWNLPTR